MRGAKYLRKVSVGAQIMLANYLQSRADLEPLLLFHPTCARLYSHRKVSE